MAAAELKLDIPSDLVRTSRACFLMVVVGGVFGRRISKLFIGAVMQTETAQKAMISICAGVVQIPRREVPKPIGAVFRCTVGIPATICVLQAKPTCYRCDEFTGDLGASEIARAWTRNLIKLQGSQGE
jgi:hypothetical protein